MDQYIARQPILNVHKKLFAYELLYRGDKDYTLDKVSGDRATASVLSSVFLTKEIDDISGYKPCFVNFPQKLIEEMLPASFPKSQIVVEILEDIEPTTKVIDACMQLHEDGYTIALDDFVYDRKFEPLIEIADIVKIDIRMTPLNTIVRTMNILARHNVKLLAEKVETIEEFEQANKMGFAYYQGYFFCKPERIKVKELSANKASLLLLLTEVTKKKTDFDRLSQIIQTDVALTYKLMRFLNSAYFYRIQEVKTVTHAIAYLGEKELRRFIMLIIISELAVEKPGELVRLVLVRAKFCELLGEASPYKYDTSELFIMGLFSLLDAMLNSTMKTLLDTLPVSDMIKKALLLQPGRYLIFLKILISIERNQLEALKPLLGKLGVNARQVSKCYHTAVTYANGML
ncbi:MAG: EAL domain-containing protein [Desulfocapsa sp.]|nr:EAL domain-containing protein [Desulfocapsa sp.]